MSTRAELLESIAHTIKDYRAGEIPEPTPDHVDRWVKQFSSAVQVPLLAELNHVLGQTYFSKEFISDFFSRQIKNKKFTGESPCDFWKGVNFLNIQKNGHSQREILALFNDALIAQCGHAMKDCGSRNGPFLYMDDVLFSGGRIGTDLVAWIQSDAPSTAVVHVVTIGMHCLGEWQCEENLKKAAQEAKKTIKFNMWTALRLENRKSKKDTSEVLWPASIPANAALAAYMSQEEKFPFSARAEGGTKVSHIFSGETGRQLLENELLLAGVKIRAKSASPKKVMRPLGFGHFGLGFGSTIVTYRNCPNNCPLALWWGDPSVTSGPFHWYPLLPRKTYGAAFGAFPF